MLVGRLLLAAALHTEGRERAKMRQWAMGVAVLTVWAAAASGAETKVGPKGQFIVDGKAVVPLAVWCQPEYLLEYWRNLGLGCVASTPGRGGEAVGLEEYLRLAERSKLGVIASFDEKAAGLPAVWGWNGGYGDRDVRRQYERLKERDGRHMVQTNFRVHDLLTGEKTEYYREAIKWTDSVICHVWPEALGSDRRNLRNVATVVDRLREWSQDRPNGEVSVWTDLNPHEWRIKKEEGGALLAAPTPAEFRFQVWLALIHGADAICVFPISFDPFVYSQIPARTEKEIMRQAQLVKRFSDVLVAEESPAKIAVRGSLKAGIVDVATRRYGGKDYVFLVNGVTEAQTVRLEVEGLGKKLELRDAIKDKAVAAKDGAYEEELKGLELRIWQIGIAEKAE